MRFKVTVTTIIEAEIEPDPDDFYIDWNNNLPYKPVEMQNVEVGVGDA